MEGSSSNCDEGLVSSNSENVSELTKEVRFLRSKTKQQDQEIAKLRENQRNINNCLCSQERYSRKDCVLISNPPFEARNSVDVTRDTLKFFQNFLGMKKDYDRIKACHLLLSNNATTNFTVIFKLIFYQDKTDVYKKRRSLRNKKKL